MTPRSCVPVRRALAHRLSPHSLRAQMAVHYGRVAVGNSLGAIFMNPIMAGLADAYGRVK